MTIREARQAAGFTQRQLGEAIHVSSQAVSMYETSHREPPVSVAKLIGKALGVDWRDFYEEDEE